MPRLPPRRRGRKFPKKGITVFSPLKPMSNGAPGTAVSTRGFSGSYGRSVGEKKFADINPASYGVNTNGSITLLCIPVLGSDFNQRIGRKIVMKSVYIRGIMGAEAAITGWTPPLASPAFLARMIILIDWQPNGAVPTIADILVTASANSQLNANNRDRFKILKDKVYAIGNMDIDTTATQTWAICGGQTVKAIKVYKKINIETIFNATNGGTIADINSGALYMVWIGTTAAGTDTDGIANLSTRVRYIDS